MTLTFQIDNESLEYCCNSLFFFFHIGVSHSLNQLHLVVVSNNYS